MSIIGRPALLIKWFAVLSLIFCAAATARGQESRGTLQVHLFLADGAPAEGIELEVAGKIAVSDYNGAAVFGVAPGRHTLVIRHRGQVVGKVAAPVTAGETTDLIITLGPPHSEPETMIEAPVESLPETEAATGQTGALVGTVRSIEGGAPVAGARVFFRGQKVEARTDSSGRFEVELPAGEHAISVIHPDYASQTVEGIEVPAEGRVSIDIEVTPSAFELEDFTVLAVRLDGGFASLQEERQESSNVIDVIGSEQIAQGGDATAAGALKRVTGLTVVGGKYVYVRGMGERYSSSLLNNSTMPSPEPERRVVPLDIFPADIIESIHIQKTYSPDMPGEFGGGAVVINTRGYPAERTASVSVSLGYREGATFEDGLFYEGGKLDWLGIDDGARALPDEVVEASEDQAILPTDMFTNKGFSPEELEEFGEAMPDVWSTYYAEVPMNLGVSTTLGDRWDVWGRPAGFLFTLAYDDDYALVEKKHIIYNVSTGGELDPRHSYEMETLTRNISLSSMLDVGMEFEPGHEIESITLLIRTTEDMTRIYQGYNADAGTEIRVTTLRWIEQMLISQQVRGSHEFVEFYGVELDWSYTYSLATRDEPNRRQTRYDLDEVTGIWFLSNRPEGNQIFYSELEDNNHDINVKVGVPIPVWSDLEAKATVGVNIVQKDREVDTRRFKFQHKGPLSNDEDVLKKDADDIFSPPYIGPDGFQLEETTRNTDNYTALQTINAAFIKLDIPITEDLDVMGGVRMEQSTQTVTTYELFNTDSEPVVAELETTDYLPALAVTWRFWKEMQLRAAYSQTVSRPEFREMSPATFEDVVGGRQVYGNPEIERAIINNYDLRWEWYPSVDESVSVGVFYKEFIDPIEVVIIPSTNPQLTYVNAPGAYNMGVEFDFRARLGFIHEDLYNYYVAGNIAYIESRVDLGEDTGVQTEDERPLQGQSPYVINLTVGYDNQDTDTRVALLYNVFGERIVEVGAQGLPDVYEEPFHQLDFVFSQGLGHGFSAGLKAKNLLDQEVVFSQGDEETESYYLGRAYSISLSWALE